MVTFILTDVKGIKKKKIKVDEETKTGKKVIGLIKNIYESQKELDIIMPGIEFDRIRLDSVKYDGDKYKPEKFFSIKSISQIDNSKKNTVKVYRSKKDNNDTLSIISDIFSNKLGLSDSNAMNNLIQAAETILKSKQEDKKKGIVPFREKEKCELIDGLYVITTSGGRKPKNKSKLIDTKKKKKSKKK